MIRIVVVVDRQSIAGSDLDELREQARKLQWQPRQSEFTRVEYLVRDFPSYEAALTGVTKLADLGTSTFHPTMPAVQTAEVIGPSMTCLLSSHESPGTLTSILGGDLADLTSPETRPPENPDPPDAGDKGPAEPPKPPAPTPQPQDETRDPNAPRFPDLHKDFWGSLLPEEQHALADEYFRATIDDQSSDSSVQAWAGMSDLVLLRRVALENRPKLAEELLRHRAGLPTTNVKLEEQKLLLFRKRVEGAGVAVEAAREVQRHMARWRELSRSAMRFMTAGVVFAAVMVFWLFVEVDLNRVPGYLVPVIIFVLAIFAISPGVLLLLERPLKGIDQFMPGGRAEDEEAKEAEEAAKKKKETDEAAAKAKAEAEKAEKAKKEAVDAAIKAGSAPGAGSHL